LISSFKNFREPADLWQQVTGSAGSGRTEEDFQFTNCKGFRDLTFKDRLKFSLDVENGALK
jgi:hypothetical protein